MSKEKLFDMAYNFCDDIGCDDDLEYIIKVMQYVLNERKEQQKEIEKEKDNYKYMKESE